jgi:hypothetical protein
MQSMETGIINRKRDRRKYLFWFLALAFLLIVTLPFTIVFLYLQWNIPGALFAAILFPISAIICPFVIIIGKFSTATIVFDFFWFIVSFILLFNAWIFAQEGHSVLHLRPRTKNDVIEILIRLKRFYGWVWLTWAEYLGYFLLYVLSPLYVVIGPLRQIVFTISQTKQMWAKDHPSFFGYLIFVFYIQVAVAIPLVVYQYLGKDRLFEGIIGAIAVITFVALQFQKMTPPYFIPTFVDSNNTSSANGTFKTKATSATPTWLYICITNLGISTFKDCVFQITFPQGFSIFDEFDFYYKDKDYAKHFVTVRGTDTIVEFLPRDNYMTFAPCTNLIFPIYVRTPKDPAEYRIVTSLSSESAWGLHRQPLVIAVTNE